MSSIVSKEEAHRLVDQLPTDAPWEELISEIDVRKAIATGLEDSIAGRTKFELLIPMILAALATDKAPRRLFQLAWHRRTHRHRHRHRDRRRVARDRVGPQVLLAVRTARDLSAHNKLGACREGFALEVVARAIGCNEPVARAG